MSTGYNFGRPYRPDLDKVATYTIDDYPPALTTLDAVAASRSAELLVLTGGRMMVTGTPAQLGGHVAQWRAEGRLLGASEPQPDGTGRYTLVVRLAPRTRAHQQQAAQQPVFWTPRRKLIAAAVAIVLAAVLAWAIAVAVAWVVDHLVAVLVIAAIAIALSVKTGPRICQTIVTVTHRH
jgi:hypothetical protein